MFCVNFAFFFLLFFPFLTVLKEKNANYTDMQF